MQTQPYAKSNIRQTAPDKAAATMNGRGAQPLLDNRMQTAIQKKQVSNMNGSKGTTLPVQKKANNTGLPDQLKNGIENLSGISMNDVKVHYNSAQPATVQAHAYAQGTDIHVAPGQEKHLPHEAWHVVQQKQGRVKPTRQLKSKVNINDEKGLETEADVMGRKALQAYSYHAGGATTIQRLATERGLVQQIMGGTQLVTQRVDWGRLLALIPAGLVIAEGLLSFASAGYAIATGPINWLQVAPALVVGGSKVIRGILMAVNALEIPGKETKALIKKGADTLRLVEAISSNVASFGGYYTTDKAKRKLAAIITGAMFSIIKLIRSVLHYFESPDSYAYSIALQAVETIEGIIVTVGGALNPQSVGIGLGVATGVSKITRGVVAGKLVYNKSKKDQGEEQRLVPENDV